jgi:hypothetical protein
MAFEDLEYPITATSVRFTPGQHVKYVPNHRSFGAFIKSDQVRDPTAEVAEDIALLAREFSPVSQRGGKQDGVRMRDRFRVIKNAGFLKVGRNVRAMVEIVNDARSAAPNEFGTRKNKRHRMLGRAGAAFGDFKPEGGPGGDA